MKRDGTPARRASSLFSVLIVLGIFSAPALAASPCPEAIISGPSSLTLPDFTSTTGGWVSTTRTLNGTPSTPKVSQGGVYLWTQVSGPSGLLTDATSPSMTFSVPDVGPSGATIVVRLTVTGCSGNASVDYPLNITDAFTPVSNNPPHAFATPSPASASEGTLVTLDGSTSYDPDGDALTYTWTQLTGTPVVLANASTAIATFLAPNVPETTTLSFRLTVSDGSLNSTADALVNVTWTNDPPVAALSCPVDADEGENVTLDGSGSADSDDGIASYQWEQLVGLPEVVGLATFTAASVNFAAPSLGFQQVGLVPFQLTVTDASGASSAAQCSVFIHDVTAPVIANTSDLVAEADSALGATVGFSTTVFDAVDGDLSFALACVPPSGSLFALGITPVDCDVSDSAGNPASAGFNVSVVDSTAPIIAFHNAVAVEATGSDGAHVPYELPTTSDAVDGSGTADCTPPPGSFPLGTTAVECSAVDTAGNDAAPTHFNVTVHDTSPPVIAAHDDEGPFEATSPAGAVVSYLDPTASDLVDGTVAVVCAPASGSTFALGTTAVICSASDLHGNVAGMSFDVTVQDTTPPTISGVSDDIVAEATSAAGTTVSYTHPTATDIVDGNVTVNCTPVSGSTFALTTTPVACTATDAHGNTAHAGFDVTVQDTTPPAIAAHGDEGPFEATGPAGAVVTYINPTASDLVDGNVAVTCLPASGSTFPLGSTQVNCSATDAHGNDAGSSFAVTVHDTRPPTISGVSTDLIAEATSAAGAAVSFANPTATDVVDGNVAVNCAPAAGSTFAIGTTPVVCTAIDAHGNTANAGFSVTVHDTTPPIISGAVDRIAEATSAAGAVVTFNPTASDLVDPSVAVSCSPLSGSTFALGTTTVHCSATDWAGNTASAHFSVAVQDTTPPAISAHANVNATASSNSSAVVTYTLPTATDLVDGAVAVSCLPASGATFAVGSTTVTCSAHDAAGNAATSTFQVIVSYAWTGFFNPVDNLPTVNTTKAGSAVPVKFSLGGNQGMAIMVASYPKSAPMQCGGATQDPLEETSTAGSSSLTYDASANQYVYVWKTEKAWAGTCRQLQLKLADGSMHLAGFSFSR